ncbi:M23 family metallopeptidase [Paenibacillus sp. FSL R10-2791]|uniref:M23 family metallopeptidase n=1 Tax=unclassified Paenibacillus TaxID=185978 RepID=UPI0030FA95E7
MSDAIAKTQETINKIKKTRRMIILLTTSSLAPYIWGLIILIALVILVIGFVLLPFFLFSTPGSLSYSSSTTDSALYAPNQLDTDGTAYIWPVPSISRVSSSFGNRDLGGIEYHKGIDIANGAEKTELQPIYAMASGVVTLAGAASGYGQVIYIDHGNNLVSKYGHLEALMYVNTGDVVSKGQLIARIGKGIVGRSTGPHLHFQIESSGKPVNPLDYVQPPGTSLDPGEYSYKPLNIPVLLDYLKKRKSALGYVETLNMIDRAAKLKNVDPYLLLAITGQEQSFVPESNNHASEIVKNPWNVFGCWCKGKGATLTTEQSATIAAQTIIKLSQDRPNGRDFIEWLSAMDNPRGYYAEHRGWWIGVRKFHNLLSELGG